MKQLIQSYKTGELTLAEVPPPKCLEEGYLVQSSASLVSAGTEKMIVDIAKKSLLGKARSRPDLVRQVLDKMKREGVSNTLQKVFTKLDTPIPLGYSLAGRIVAKGQFSGDLAIGQRVACGGAGFANHAEINYVPKNLLTKIPDSVSDLEASFVTVGAIALQGVRQAQVQLGEKVAVLGLGLIGQLTVQLLKASGCVVLGSDVDSKKIELAKKLGANQATHASSLIDMANEFSEGLGVDKVIITASASGNGLVTDAGHICRQKGKVVVVGLVGMDIPRDTYYRKELDFCLSMAYGPGRYDPEYELSGIDYPYNYVRWTEQRNFEAFLQMVAEKRVTPEALVTHQFDFDQALNAYDLLTGKVQEDYLGIVLSYSHRAFETMPRQVELGSTFQKKEGVIALGLIGAGNFTKAVLLPELQKNPAFSLAGLVTSTGMSAQVTGKKFGFHRVSTEESTLFEDRNLDALMITTPHHFHANSVLGALTNGKHVFVEKPLCINQAELDAIRNFFNEKSEAPILQVGFNRRFSPAVRKMKEALPEGAPISINYRVNAGVIPTDHWIQELTQGGGRIIGEVCHFIDTASYLTGSEVEAVFAHCVRTTDQSIPDRDNVSIVLEYKNGSMATITYYAYGNPQLPKEHLEVFSRGQALVMEDFRKLSVYGGSGVQKQKWSAQDKGFRAELDAFAQAVKTGVPAISLQSLFNTTEATLAIHESLKTRERCLLRG